MKKSLILLAVLMITSALSTCWCHHDHGKHKGWFKYDQMPDQPER